MRPASEVHSAMVLLRGELDRLAPKPAPFADKDVDDLTREEAAAFGDVLMTWHHMRIAHDTLAWVLGESALAFAEPTAWLAAYLLDDPPQLDNTPPEAN